MFKTFFNDIRAEKFTIHKVNLQKKVRNINPLLINLILMIRTIQSIFNSIIEVQIVLFLELEYIPLQFDEILVHQ